MALKKVNGRQEVEELIEEELKSLLGESYTDLKFNIIISVVQDVYETSSVGINGKINMSDIRLACQRTIVEYINS